MQELQDYCSISKGVPYDFRIGLPRNAPPPKGNTRSLGHRTCLEVRQTVLPRKCPKSQELCNILRKNVTKSENVAKVKNSRIM